MLPLENENLEENKIDFLQEWENELAEEKNKIQQAKQNLKVLETKIKFRENLISRREDKLEQIEAEQAEREERLKISEETAEEITKLAAILDIQQEEVAKQKISLQTLQKELSKREEELQTKISEQETLQVESLRKKINSIRDLEMRNLKVELEKMRKEVTREVDRRRFSLEMESNSRIASVDEELKKRREIFNKNLEKRRGEFEAELEKQREILETEFKNKQIDLQKKYSDALEIDEKKLQEQKNILLEKEQSLKKIQSQLELDKKRLEFEKNKLQNFDINSENLQKNLTAEIEKQNAEKISSLQKANKILRAELKSAGEKILSYETFQAIYGDNPEVLQQKISDLQNAYDSMQKEFSKRPGPEILQQFENLKAEYSKLQKNFQAEISQIGILQKQVVEVEKLRNSNTILQESNDLLHAQWSEAQDLIKNYAEQIQRLTATKKSPADWENRAASLREPYLKNPFNAGEDEKIVDEILWLKNLDDACKNYGISFPKRILYAFHTSFKIANWSTLTVLAGVSGTGKSELPKLYSAFGGFNFINVPVQPNWDSQESMLGFFNSIDNKFDAQPVLRFLVECSEKFSNNMAVVLLDEMNLAHVEHYFADFLSKLELRRSSGENEVPEIFVNLGAGVKPYSLKLTRNILWTGTMNQDETTKSLSDKVLDRGIVINFPRPRILKDRDQAKNLDEVCEKLNIQPMSRQIWNSWIVDKISLSSAQLKNLNDYRKLLEEMNDNLSYAGRAIGHRVWQSIEHYVINYPVVRAEILKSKGELTTDLSRAFHIAVEDQIVQKVMPKLRGIDTRGKSYEKCLAPIKEQLHDAGFNLDEDFDRACEMGYGQFIWNSAEYIEDES